MVVELPAELLAELDAVVELEPADEGTLEVDEELESVDETMEVLVDVEFVVEATPAEIPCTFEASGLPADAVATNGLEAPPPPV